jgi:hypothetical protein
VTEMMVDKCKEMQHATIELKEYCKIHELTTTQKKKKGVPTTRLQRL